MLQKLKELQQTCCILSELYDEYRCIYYGRDFSSSNLDYLEIPFLQNWSFVKFIRMDFTFDEEKVIINYGEERFFIPIELIGKPRKEIEKWYKEKVEDLKEKQAEEQAAKVYAFKLQIERLTEELKQLNS